MQVPWPLSHHRSNMSISSSLWQHFCRSSSVTQQGRLLDVEGKVPPNTNSHFDLWMTWRCYAQWEDTLSVDFDNGYYSSYWEPWRENPLDDAIFQIIPCLGSKWMENLSPRQPITSVPYAQIAGVAEVAESVDGGSVNASEISINGTPVVDSNGNWIGLTNLDFNNRQHTRRTIGRRWQHNSVKWSRRLCKQFTGQSWNGISEMARYCNCSTYNSYLRRFYGDNDSLGALVVRENAAGRKYFLVCVSDSTLFADIEDMLPIMRWI